MASIRNLPLVLLLLTTGCAGYQIGTRTLYRQDIRTVAVPMFRSQSLRRNLGEWLTEAVVKEIEQQTSYKVVHSGNADSILDGEIVSVSKRVLAENADDEPRNLEVDTYVRVRWTDRVGNPLFQQSIPLGVPGLTVSEEANFIPEAGQSMSVAQQQNIRQIAKQIVARMEFTPL